MCHNKKELQSAVSKYRRLQSAKVEVEKRLDELKAEINEYLDYNGIQPKEKVIGPNYIVSYSVFERGSFNTDRLKEELGENLDYFKDFTKCRRLTVK